MPFLASATCHPGMVLLRQGHTCTLLLARSLPQSWQERAGVQCCFAFQNKQLPASLEFDYSHHPNCLLQHSVVITCCAGSSSLSSMPSTALTRPSQKASAVILVSLCWAPQRPLRVERNPSSRYCDCQWTSADQGDRLSCSWVVETHARQMMHNACCDRNFALCVLAICCQWAAVQYKRHSSKLLSCPAYAFRFVSDLVLTKCYHGVSVSWSMFRSRSG